MALRTPPSWLQNGSHPAENDRLTAQAIWKTTGVINPTDLIVSQSATPAMSVSVAAGWAAIVGTYQSNMGTYLAYNDAATNLTVTTANATLPRIDIVVATVSDSYYTGTTNTVAFQVIAGSPNASPIQPSTPTNSILLAVIAVGAAVTSIVNANITDSRVRATSPLSYLSINAQTGTTYTPVIGDANNFITLTNASAIAVTIPPNSSVAYPIGTQLNFSQNGAGQVTFSQGSGVTITSTGATASAPKTRVQYSAATAIQITTNNWLIVGDLA